MKKAIKIWARGVAALAMSLGLASAGIVLPAPAQASPGCWEQVENECSYLYQGWGYSDAQDCAQKEPCMVCPRDGHTCYEIDWIDNDPFGRHALHPH
jgi:hypothetical protein